MPTQSRRYDLVLLGATGYTGQLVAEYLFSKSPTSLRWAVAGKSPNKLDNLLEKLSQVNSNRSQPAIEIVELNIKQLSELVQSTKVLINAIGPYSTYGSAVIEACAMNGTHYLDFCAETPWIAEMISKYHEVAKANSAKIIPAIGNSSSPSDITTFLMATECTKVYNSPLKSSTCSFNMKINGMSAGSIASVTSVVNRYGISQLMSPNSYLLRPTVSPTLLPPAKPILTRNLGYLRHTHLGDLTTSFAAAGNSAVVQRTSHLHHHLYDPTFTYQEFMPVTSMFQGILIHLLTKLAILMLALPPFCAFINYLQPLPGTGPSMKVSEGESIELRVCGTYANGRESTASLTAEYSYHGSMYYHSALLAAEAAMTLLQEEAIPDRQDKHEEQYGFLTPSFLGVSFIERLRIAGVRIEVDGCKKND